MDDTERRLATVEAELSALPRIEDKLDKVLEMSGTLQHIRERQDEQSAGISKAFSTIEGTGERLTTLERVVESRHAYTRGLMAAATVFWVVLQGIVGYALTDTIEMVRADHEAMIRFEEAHERVNGWQNNTLPKP